MSKYIDESETILRKAAGGAVELSELEVQTVQDTLDMLATQFGVATTKFTGAADEVATASSLISQANKIMETEFAAKVKQAQQDAVTWAQDNVLSGYTSLPTAKQQMDYMMQTNYSGVRTGADKIWEIDARAASSDRGRYEDIKERYVDDLSAELTNNQYLNGEKSLDSYNWTKAGYSDTSKYERALAFSAWMQSISPGFTDMVSNLGLNKENILDKFGDIPLNYEN